MLKWIRRWIGRGGETPRRKQPKPSLTQRIDNIVTNSRPKQAIRRLTGYRAQHYWHAYLRYTLGTLHLHHGDRLVAGNLLYFKANKTPAEQRAVDDLRRHHGGDPAHLLRALVGQYPRPPQDLRAEVKQELWEQAKTVRQQEGMVPRFLQQWYPCLERELGVTEEG